MELKKISDLFWSVSPKLFLCSIILSLVTGLCYSSLIPFLMYVVGNNTYDNIQAGTENYNFFNSPTSDMALIFLVICLAIIIIKTISTVLSMYITSRASLEHRLSLYRRIQALSYIDLERIGQPRLINLLNLDVPAVAGAAMTLPSIWVNTVTLLGTLGYLVYLDLKVFFFVVCSLAIAMVTYQLPVLFGARYFSAAREANDRVQKGVGGLIYGAKELKLSKNKSAEFFQEELVDPENVAFVNNLKGISVLVLAENYGSTICFLVISVVIFHFYYVFHLTQMELSGIVMALLYLTGPVSIILGAVRGFQQGKVSLNKLKGFYRELVDENCLAKNNIKKDWDFIRFNNIHFSYPNQDVEFSLQDICAEFRKGQISYIIGGNGSGKSTFGKIVSLHYHPTLGSIMFGESLVNRENLASAREFICAIYSDFRLFPKIYGKFDPQKVSQYLELLQLTDKVSVNDGYFSSTDLSDGQRKRLALLTALLEDREIYLFDEWAADQDPQFKSVFYRKILPELKLRKKIVIVISHDDRYFDCADQIITLENGNVLRRLDRQMQRALVPDII